jgi:hypothetical protein
MEHTLFKLKGCGSIGGAIILGATCVAKSNMVEPLVSVQVIGNNRCIVLWSVVIVDPSSSFDDQPEGWKIHYCVTQ